MRCCGKVFYTVVETRFTFAVAAVGEVKMDEVKYGLGRIDFEEGSNTQV
jgi:hypothetical protein